MNSLINFRSTFVAAIADSWNNENFRKEFVESGKDLLGFLQYKTIENEEKEHSVVDNCVFINPWKSVEIVFAYPDLVWKPVEENGWTGDNSGVLITIPKIPEGDSELSNAELLAKYFNIFPTFYGGLKTEKEILSELKLDFPHRFENIVTTSFDMLSTYITGHSAAQVSDHLEDFTAVILQVIAKYWNNEGFRKEVTPENELFNILDKKVPTDKSPILSKHFEYKNPWNMNIVFQYDENFDLSDGKQAADTYPKNKILLSYPQVPDVVTKSSSHREIEPIALADYNKEGAALPFSCC